MPTALEDIGGFGFDATVPLAHPRGAAARVSSPLPTPDILTVYGADWCADCRYARRILDAAGVQYRYVDLRVDRAGQELLANAGILAIPVVVTSDGRVLIDPSRRELESAVGIASG